MTTPITQNEIDEVLNICADFEEQGYTNAPGMTYEQGVKATLEWLFQGQPNPTND